MSSTNHFTNPRPALFSKTLGFIRVFCSPSFFWFLLCVACVTAILHWRRPDSFYNPQLWAEDGNCFFTNSFQYGIGSLFIPMAGYYHTLARVTALMGTLFPISYLPQIYAFMSWCLLILIIGYIFSARFSFKNELKFLLGLALVANAADNEVFFNLANWATITAFFWILLSISNEPKSLLQLFLDYAVLIVMGLNSPFVICLWPLFLLRWRTRRTNVSLGLFILSIVIVLMQIWNMSYRIEQGGLLPSGTVPLLDLLIYRFGFKFFGNQIYQLQLTDILRIYGGFFVLSFYSYLGYYSIKTKNWPAVIILVSGIMTEALSIYVSRHNLTEMVRETGRHFFIPTVTLIWALLLSKITPRYLRFAPLVMFFIAFLFLTPQSKYQTYRNLDWGGHTAACLNTSQQNCRIPIQPEGWAAYLGIPRNPCQ